MITKIFAFLVVVIIIILFYFHYKKFSKKSLDYEIIQQEMDLVNGYNLYTLVHPLIISFIEEKPLMYNVEKYSLYSPLTISKNSLRLVSFTDSYVSHQNEILLIRPTSDIKITLINPKYKKHFNKQKILNGGLVKYHSLDTIHETQSIDIIVREYTILAVPRFWFFTFDKKHIDLQVLSTQNIFTLVFSLLK